MLDRWIRQHPIASAALATATALFVAALAYIWK